MILLYVVGSPFGETETRFVSMVFHTEYYSPDCAWYGGQGWCRCGCSWHPCMDEKGHSEIHVLHMEV